MTSIYTIKLSEIQDKEEYLFRCADRSRREKAELFRQKDDRLRCLAAGYLMKHYVPGFSEERLYYGEQGKPFLRGGMPFSISHGGNFIVLTVCRDAESIGVDVENIREIEWYRDILPCSMTENERMFVGDSANRAVFIWTRKESLFKCSGEVITDISDLPEVIQDRVFFCGHPVVLNSRESDNHIFSVAWRGADASVTHSIDITRVHITYTD